MSRIRGGVITRMWDDATYSDEGCREEEHGQKRNGSHLARVLSGVFGDLEVRLRVLVTDLTPRLTAQVPRGGFLSASRIRTGDRRLRTCFLRTSCVDSARPSRTIVHSWIFRSYSVLISLSRFCMRRPATMADSRHILGPRVAVVDPSVLLPDEETASSIVGRASTSRSSMAMCSSIFVSSCCHARSAIRNRLTSIQRSTE